VWWLVVGVLCAFFFALLFLPCTFFFSFSCEPSVGLISSLNNVFLFFFFFFLLWQFFFPGIRLLVQMDCFTTFFNAYHYI